MKKTYKRLKYSDTK